MPRSIALLARAAIVTASLAVAPRFEYVPVAGHAVRTDGGVIAGAFGTTA